MHFGAPDDKFHQHFLTSGVKLISKSISPKVFENLPLVDV